MKRAHAHKSLNRIYGAGVIKLLFIDYEVKVYEEIVSLNGIYEGELIISSLQLYREH